jgi:hypothetical protein
VKYEGVIGVGIIIVSEGGAYERGLIHGRFARPFIKENVRTFYRALASLGVTRDNLLSILGGRVEEMDDEFYDYVRGLADGSGISNQDLLAMNMFKPMFFPDECTVMIAMRDSTLNGSTLVLKNSDKIGSEKFVGERFYRNKEINIVVFEKPDSGNRFIGVAAAGEAGLKMGMNERGVMVGTNIARTLELKSMKVDVTQMRALDRAWLAREGVMKADNAKSAVQIVSRFLVDRPMATPGNLEFVDRDEGYVIEGSYNMLAIETFKEGVHVRTNRFQILERLNDPGDISSYVRYIRGMELLNENKGKINAEKMIEFSQDHKHGPGLNSICRHSGDFRDETSLSSAVMEVKADNECIFYVALGKPCKAWRDKEGHTVINLRDPPDKVSEGFYNGTVFKKFYEE